MKSNWHQYKDALFLSVSLGWVELEINLLSKSHKLYRSAIFQPMYGLS